MDRLKGRSIGSTGKREYLQGLENLDVAWKREGQQICGRFVTGIVWFVSIL